MKQILVFVLLYCFFVTSSLGQEKAFQIYNAKGDKISYRLLSIAAGKSDVILFGENHNDPISHWLQFELLKSLFNQHGGNLMLGAEMIESDDQIKLNEYLMGFIREKDFEKESKLWPNHETDYRALIRFAKDNHLHFVATNIPRRFANMVYLLKFETQ